MARDEIRLTYESHQHLDGDHTSALCTCRLCCVVISVIVSPAAWLLRQKRVHQIHYQLSGFALLVRKDKGIYACGYRVVGVHVSNGSQRFEVI